MLSDCLDRPTASLLSENKTGRQYVNFSMLRKKLHSIVVELPMLKDNLRRIGGVETLLYIFRQKNNFISSSEQHLQASNSVSRYAFI